VDSQFAGYMHVILTLFYLWIWGERCFLGTFCPWCGPVPWMGCCLPVLFFYLCSFSQPEFSISSVFTGITNAFSFLLCCVLSFSSFRDPRAYKSSLGGQMKPKSTGRKTGKSMTGETRVLSDVLHPCGPQTHTQDRSELLLFYWDSALSSLEGFLTGGAL